MLRKRESRKVLWAILASVFIHLAVAFSLAAFGNKLSPSPELDDKPAELTIVDVSATPPPVVPTNPPFMETDESKKSAEAPKEKTFESNANSIAASQLPANGDNPLPTQEGKERPFVDLETHPSSLAIEGAQSQSQPTPAPELKPTAPPVASATPTPQATEPPKSTPTPPPVATPEPEQFAMLTATPPPPIRAPEEVETSPTPETAVSTPPPRPKPEQPDSAYRAYKEQTRISGRITNRGASAVNAVDTPLGRYQKSIYDSIGSHWLYYVKKQVDLVSIGTARVSFSIDRHGHVENLKMIANSSNESFANVCLQSIQDAKAPPIPDEVSDILPAEGLTFEINFTLFANE
jgi:outer membrane biosynthesis protein TonB